MNTYVYAGITVCLVCVGTIGSTITILRRRLGRNIAFKLAEGEECGERATVLANDIPTQGFVLNGMKHPIAITRNSSGGFQAWSCKKSRKDPATVMLHRRVAKITDDAAPWLADKIPFYTGDSAPVEASRGAAVLGATPA